MWYAHHMPRQSKLTPEIIQEITTHIGRGLTNQDACLLVGINQSTLYRWLDRAEKAEKGPYLALKEAMKRAEVKFKQTHLAVITKASLELTERTHRERIELPGGRREKRPPVQISGCFR